MNENAPKKENTFLEVGYKAGIILSFAGLILSATYLFVFLWISPELNPAGREIHLLDVVTERRFLLLSTAIFVGMSFGFLGFALFLLQAKGDLDMELETQNYKLKFARLAPGLFVILCATVIIIFSATYRVSVEMKSTTEEATSARSASEDSKAQRIQKSKAIRSDDLFNQQPSK